MKKIAMLVAFLWVANFSLFAQEGELRLGFQMSPAFSWISTDDNQINGNGSNLAARLGIMGEYYFRENYAFIGGLGFAFNQGGTLKHELGGAFWTKSDLSIEALVENNPTNPDYDTPPFPDKANLKYSIQYIEIPFGLKLRTREFGYIRYYAEIPVFTIGFRGQSRGSVSGVPEDRQTEKENIKKDVNVFNLSWGFGGGLEYGLSDKTSLVGGIFFQRGFTDVTKNSGTTYYVEDFIADGRKENSKGTINSITIKLGVLF